MIKKTLIFLVLIAIMQSKIHEFNFENHHNTKVFFDHRETTKMLLNGRDWKPLENNKIKIVSLEQLSNQTFVEFTVSSFDQTEIIFYNKEESKHMQIFLIPDHLTYEISFKENTIRAKVNQIVVLKFDTTEFFSIMQVVEFDHDKVKLIENRRTTQSARGKNIKFFDEFIFEAQEEGIFTLNFTYSKYENEERHYSLDLIVS